MFCARVSPANRSPRLANKSLALERAQRHRAAVQVAELEVGGRLAGEIDALGLAGQHPVAHLAGTRRGMEHKQAVRDRRADART